MMTIRAVSLRKNFRRVALAAILLIGIPAILAARAQPEDLIVNDPAVRTGVLDNGLHYFVKANDKPKGMAELRLAVRAGSIQEDDDQLGLAHFTEHMLFNGTERFPENELINVLESFGMAFGPEINAFTTFDQTVYRLNVSTSDRDQFLLGLDVLEEWAFRATLTEEEFEKERGVVHEEWRVGRGSRARIQDQTYPILFAGSRYAERRPIGDPNIILDAPVEALRRFYDQWYRPDLMAVIAVGDFDPDETVLHIKERFSGYQGPDNPEPRISYPIPGHDDTLIGVIDDPEATRTTIQVLVKYDTPVVRYRPDLERDLAERLYFVMLNQRFEEMSRKEGSPFLQGYGFSTAYTDQTSLAGLAAAVSEDRILTGLEAILTEAERVRRFGFLETELDRAKKNVFSSFENYWKQRNDLESSAYVQPLLDAFVKGDSYPSIDWQWDAVQDLLPEVTLDDVRNVADRLLDESNRVVLITGPSVPALTELPDGKIRETLARAEKAILDPWVDEGVSGPLVASPPRSGRIVSRSTVPGTEISVWLLSNGATVFVLPTDYKNDEILFRALSPGGSSQVEDPDFLSSQFSTDAVSEGGIGEYSADELRKILTGENVALTPFIQGTFEGFTGSATPEDLETMLQLLYLHHTAARKDSATWNAFMVRMNEYLRNRAADPRNVYEDLVWETLNDGHFRSLPLTTEDLADVDLDQALAVYRERFADSSDFAYIFVGDVDPMALEPLVELWIGGLPAGESGEGWADRGMRSPDGIREEILRAGREPLSVVTQVWTGEWDGSFTERYRLQSLAAALEMQFTRTIREESSGTYSVGVYPQLETSPVNSYRFIVRYSCDPDRVDELSTLVKETIDSWRLGPPEQKYAFDVAASQRRSLEENMERNGWWLGQIVFAIATGEEPGTLMNRSALYDSLTPEILNTTAMRYLDDQQYVEIVLFPEETD